MADYYHGGRASMYDDCYDAGRHGGGSMKAYSRTDEYYDNVQDDRIRMRPVYADDDCTGYNGGGYGAGRQTAVYTTDEYSRGGGYGGYGGEQEHFKREEREHKHKERLGEVGALAGGAFALVINVATIIINLDRSTSVCVYIYIYIIPADGTYGAHA
jgi:hypothetical protein